jgi:hypothetical protein
VYTLTFSDSAKFAEVAKNLAQGAGYIMHNSFFNAITVANYQPGSAFQVSFLPLTSYFFTLLFKIFPASDLTVVVAGYILFFLSLVLVFFLTKKLHSVKAGIVASVLMGLNFYFLDYAHNASSEVFFILEILLFTYLLLFRNKIKVLAIIPLILMFYTRQQASVFVIGFVGFALIYSWLNFPKMRKVILAGGLVSVILFLFFYKSNSLVSPSAMSGAFNISTRISTGDYLRGGKYQLSPGESIFSKLFYNTYNFVKAPERLISPIIFILFFFSLFINKLKTKVSAFNWFTLTQICIFILAASITLPNARYVHPVIPLMLISASIALVEISIKFKWQNLFLALSVMFVTLPVIGNYTLDYRFQSKILNLDKPPVYKVIADKMAESIPQGRLIITNLDTWGAWYHGLTTMLFPITPDMLIPIYGKKLNVDYIAISNYQENDPSLALGEWKETVYSPNKITNKFLAENFVLLKTEVITPDMVKENQTYYLTILKKK